MEEQTLILLAADGFIKELGLKDSDRHLLEGHIEFRDAEPGITLLRENCPDVNDAALHLAIKNVMITEFIFYNF